MRRLIRSLVVAVSVSLTAWMAWGGSTWTLPCTGDTVTCSAGTYNLGTLTLTTPLAAGQGGTGLSSLGTGVATWLGTPSSANLASAVTGETGSGALVFDTSPTFTTSVALPASLTFAADTAVTLSGGVNGINFDSDTLSIDATNNRVGIGTYLPNKALTVVDSNSLGGIDIRGTNAPALTLWDVSDNAMSYIMAQNDGVLIMSADQPSAETGTYIRFDIDNIAQMTIEPGEVGIGTTAPAGKLVVKDGHIHSAQATIPTCTCQGGGTCTVTTSSTDVAGEVSCAATVGTSITIANNKTGTWTLAPICMAQNATTGNILVPSTTTTALTVTGTITAADKIRYICIGNEA